MAAANRPSPDITAGKVIYFAAIDRSLPSSAWIPTVLNQLPSQFPWLLRLRSSIAPNLLESSQANGLGNLWGVFQTDWQQSLDRQEWQSGFQASGFQGLLSQGKRRAGLGLILLLPAMALLVWNWKLLLTLAVGFAAMALVSSLQTRDWQPLIAGLRHWLTGPHRLLLVSVPCGGLAMLSTYMAVSVWDDSHSVWLVACLLLQGLGQLAGLGLLSRQLLQQQGDRANHQLDQTLAELTHPNPLSRLLAVRQLNRLLERRTLTPEQAHLATQALQLLLLQEREAIVREATLRSLSPSSLRPEFSPPETSSP
jgi:hypothetical protein